MISRIYARVLEELKKLDGALSLDEEIALHEYDKLGTTSEVSFEWKKKQTLALT